MVWRQKIGSKIMKTIQTIQNEENVGCKACFGKFAMEKQGLNINSNTRFYWQIFTRKLANFCAEISIFLRKQ